MLTQQQKQNRYRCIGASDAAAVLGVNPYKTPLEAYMEIMGLTVREEEKIGSPTYMGNLYEPAVAKFYEDFTGMRLRYSHNTLRHRQYPYIICHLDRKIANQRKILECKTTQWGNSEEWGDSGTSHAPRLYIIQVQHQMGITNYDEADIAVIIKGYDFRYYTIKRDDIIIKTIIEREREFYETHILPEIPPPATCKNDVNLLYKKDNDNIIEATDEIAEYVAKLTELKIQTKSIEKQKAEYQDKIALFMLDTPVLLYNGKVILTWKFDRNKTRRMEVKK